jgi:hypothetical protein
MAYTIHFGNNTKELRLIPNLLSGYVQSLVFYSSVIPKEEFYVQLHEMFIPLPYTDVLFVIRLLCIYGKNNPSKSCKLNESALSC